MKKINEYMFANFRYPGPPTRETPEAIVNLTKNAQVAGGPASPVSVMADAGELIFFGKTLRDSFAEAALQGLLANPSEVKIEGGMDEVQKHYAKIAYGYADAMLAHRDKP